MSNFDDLEKLASLKETGVLSKEEFQTQKEILLKKTAAPTQQKELSSYLLLAYFLGVFGAHNFYIGKTTKGVVQLLLTLLTGWLIFPLFLVCIWVFVEICITTKDAKGQDLLPNRALRILFIVLQSLTILLPFLAILFFLGVLGTAIAIQAANVSDMTSYFTHLSYVNSTYPNPERMKVCSYLNPVPSDLRREFTSCSVSKVGKKQIIKLQNVSPKIKRQLQRAFTTKTNEKGDLLLVF